MRTLLLSILTFLINVSYCQTPQWTDELYGFRLGQYKSVVTNELGDPSQTRMLEDSTVVDFYYLSKDSSTYIGFQYLSSKPKEIYAIQLSGVRAERHFYGINLGDTEVKVKSVFGKPDSVVTQDFHDKGAQTWRFDKFNLSLLFHDNKVASIRIWDDYEQKDYDYPALAELLEIISTKNKARIADILSPGLEVYYCDKVITWKNSFYKDLFLEKGSVMEFITDERFGLITLKGNKDLKVDENIRVVTGAGTFPVFKFPKEYLIIEMVLNYQQGRYKIWEVKFKCQN